jgi:N-acetylglucosamine-6-phosphate deacetylase
VITPSGILESAVGSAGGRIRAIRTRAPRGARRISVRGAYVAPGFIDLHVWGDPARLARRLPREGTTAFLATIGPQPQAQLLECVAKRPRLPGDGARCLGWHLEGPWLNPRRAGALAGRWMRPPRLADVRRVVSAARGAVRLVSLAPEQPRAEEAIRWLRRRGIVVSLGHSIANEADTRRAVEAGASAVTHVFNGMPTLHHRQAGLLSVALTDERLTTMVIADGVHVGEEALRLLLLAKSPLRVALATDSIEDAGWHVRRRGRAFYTRAGVLAGSRLTMMQAVRHMVRCGAASLESAVRMASEVPARLLGSRTRGRLNVGARADLVAFDKNFRALLTIIGGQIAFQRGS